MNDLLERYLGAVCSYFFGQKRQYVYHDLKQQISQSVHQYEDMEDLLISYGHPLSVAYSYGYRPIVFHHFNPYIVNLMKNLFLLFQESIFLYQRFIILNNLAVYPFNLQIMSLQR